MEKKIKEIAMLKSGVYANPSDEGKVIYVQARHFDQNGEFNTRVKSYLDVDDKTAKELLADHDILFAAKGSRNFAVVYDGSNGPAVASTSFIIVRINPEYCKLIIPEYISWFINHSRTQRQLKAEAKGTFIPAITIKTLRHITIEIPDIEKQQLILSISLLRKKERQLFAEIDAVREQLIQTELISSTHQ